MKKLITGLLLLLLVAIAAPQVGAYPPPLEPMVNTTEEEKKDTKLSMSMEIPNPYGQLSDLTFVANRKGYMKIFSGLSVSDVTRMWNDFIVLKEIYKVTDVVIFINSPGGDAFSGLALADHIRRAIEVENFTVTANASGIVASAAVPVFAVCQTRQASPGTIFMVHEASLWKWPGQETASDIRAQNELMELLRSRYINILVKHTMPDIDPAERMKRWREMEGRTTWFDVNKAKEYGLVDDIR